jgi:hypothetical protein
LIGGVEQMSIQLGSQQRADPTSGDPYPSHVALVAQKPMARFSTKHLKTALDATGLFGIKIASATNPGLELFAQKYTEGSTPASGANHRKYTIREGILLPRSLSCSHQGDATLQYEALATWDGTNNPVVIADSSSLPTGLTDAQRFTLEDVVIGGIAIPQVTQLDLDFGLTAQTEGSNSDIWDTHCTVRQTRPSITLRGIDIEWFKSAVVPILGLAATHANTSIKLRKREVGGSFVADGTAEHIVITACGMAAIDTAFDARTNENAETSTLLPCRYDGTNYPIVINTASAI